MKYPRNTNARLSSHFHSSEFDCHCKNLCSETEIDPDLIVKLEALRALLKSPLKITSGYRCADYQQDLRSRGFDTASGTSQHELGRAADVVRADTSIPGAELEKLARQVGFTSVGVAKDWVHVDLRPGYRRWEYK